MKVVRAAAVLIAALVIPAILAGEQQPLFRAKAEAVRLDVLVTRGGRPVDGLGKGDFEVYEDGVRQDVDSAGLEDLPLNLVLALDVSGSVVGEPLRDLREASRALVGALHQEDQSAVITFNHRIRLDCPLTVDRVKVFDALEHLAGTGGTALLDATYASLVQAESTPARTLVVVFTDGEDTASYATPGAVLEIARRTNAVVYGVALPPGGRARSLESISKQTGGSLLIARASSDLRAIFVGILDGFRHRYLISYTPKGERRAGWHAIDVRTRQRGLKVRVRPGYTID
jgi:VWFA-related protein